jgi:uncharacterized membrane protein YqjE
MTPKPDRPLLADIKDDLGRMAADAREMLALRWELARLELRADGRAARRLAIVLGVAVVLVLTALPLLVLAAAEWLGLSTAGWLCLIGVALIAIAAIVAYVAWRGFRRRFTGMAHSLEELREDLVWLREWTGQRE